jgi:hypothetical protein
MMKTCDAQLFLTDSHSGVRPDFGGPPVKMRFFTTWTTAWPDFFGAKVEKDHTLVKTDDIDFFWGFVYKITEMWQRRNDIFAAPAVSSDAALLEPDAERYRPAKSSCHCFPTGPTRLK